jgi:protoporphyrinogen/coproporphyrinogen III oxidase
VSSTDPTYAVVGGGVSGIAAAHYLQELGFVPEILERDTQLGGRIGVAELNGRHVELGGKNIGHRYALFRAFAAHHGAPVWEHVGVNTARVEDGKLRTIDSSRRIRSFVTQLSRRSPRDLARFACMALRIRWDERNGFLGGPGFRRLATRTDDPPVTACFTRAFCQDAWRPMSLLMNAAEPDEIHVGNLGTNVGMALDDYDQLADGMGPLLERFRAATEVRLGVTVQGLLVRDGRVVGVVTSDGEERLYDGVVLALPAHASAALVAEHLPSVADELRAIRYFPTAVVVAEYDRDVFRPDVRALRFDEGEVLSSARAYGKETLNVVRYTFSGREARPLLAGALDREGLLDRAEASLGRHFPVKGRVGSVAPERAFELCAYSAHHAERLDRIARGVQGLQGVFLTGDYLRGASIEACFRAARECVAAIGPQTLQAA